MQVLDSFCCLGGGPALAWLLANPAPTLATFRQATDCRFLAKDILIIARLGPAKTVYALRDALPTRGEGGALRRGSFGDRQGGKTLLVARFLHRGCFVCGAFLWVCAMVSIIFMPLMQIFNSVDDNADNSKNNYSNKNNDIINARAKYQD